MWVPRWAVLGVAALLLFLLGLRIWVPPSWVVQQLDAPDGRRSARLLRTRYVKDSFTIRVRETKFWRTVYYSDPLPDDLRVDLGERLFWTGDSSRLLFRMKNRVVWGYDFQQHRPLTETEIGRTQ
ncbi:MAG: hypothetical protein BWY59_00115 [Verrucomicrobia bacterium ADurb.Bin345]|nr:MAG: hypothetical protein BWY59_00115 [Verrucomicrobia bacterium ADurb.Bin345]